MKNKDIVNFDKIRKENRLLIEFVRGSTCYGLNTPQSDVDTGGVYIALPDEILGMYGYMPQVSDDKHDNTWYEIGNFIELLTKSNPTVMEALFVPDDKIIGEVHPLFKELRDNRQMFLSKDCYWPFYGYAKSQIEKARGLNKKIVNPIVERKTPLDFTHTFLNQGSQPIVNWLNKYGLKLEFCGLNKIPHMNDMYGLFYDWGGHLAKYPNDAYILTNTRFLLNADRIDRFPTIEHEPIMHYRGLIAEEISHTTQLRLSSIDDKLDKPLCHVSYNVDGFSDHCRRYKEYKEWENSRNPARYESNLDKNYDSKNIMHCFRLIHMCKEILRDHEFNLVRTWDHDFLMDVRNHKYEYDYLIEKLTEETKEMDEIFKKSTLPDHVDKVKLNQILLNIRKKYLGI